MTLEFIKRRHKKSSEIFLHIDAAGYGILSAGAMDALNANKVALAFDRKKHNLVFIPIKDARKFSGKIHKLTSIQGREAKKISLMGFLNHFELKLKKKKLNGNSTPEGILFSIHKVK